TGSRSVRRRLRGVPPPPRRVAVGLRKRERAPGARLPGGRAARGPAGPLRLGAVVARRRFPAAVTSRRAGRRPLELYLLGPYRTPGAPAPTSRRLTSLRSRGFDSPANRVGPWPASRGCTTSSYSSINASSDSACASFTPPTDSPLPGSDLSL